MCVGAALLCLIAGMYFLPNALLQNTETVGRNDTLGNVLRLAHYGIASRLDLICCFTAAAIVIGIVIVAVFGIVDRSRASNRSLHAERVEARDDDRARIASPESDEPTWPAMGIDGIVMSLREEKAELQRRNEDLERANRELAASNHALENAVEGIAKIIDTGQIVDFNSAFAEMHGYADREVTKLHWQTLIAAEDQERFGEAIAEMNVKGVVRCEVRGRRRDGSFFHEEVTLVQALDSNGCVAAGHWFSRDMSERRELEARIKHQAFHDALTGLPNRALFVDRLRTACRHARRRGQSLAVLFIDLDDFKAINDSMGHEAGDRLLACVAERIKGCVRNQDTVARLGGDEFTVLLDPVSGQSEATDVARRISESLQSAFSLPAGKAFTSASTGIAVCSNGEDDPEKVLHDADLAMYFAKHNSRRSYAVFTPEMGAPIVERKQLAEALREALSRGRLSFCYQPLVDLKSGKATGVEAFLRWYEEGWGDVSPELTISVAEESGLMDAVGTWALREGCLQMKAWLDALPEPSGLTIHVNLTSSQLLHTDVTDAIASALADSKLPADRLVLEVSARSLADDPDIALARLRDLKKTGIRLALDDFGTGSHLISRLAEYPFDMVKIDGTVTWVVEDREDARALAQAMLIMAKSANAQVVAEGIETLGQLKCLRDLGCTRGQGYMLCKPLTADELLPKLLADAFIPVFTEEIAPDLAA